MKILIDMQSCQSASKYRGVGRYTESLVQAVLKIDQQNDYHLMLNGALGGIEEIKTTFHSLIPVENIHIWEQYRDISAYHSRKKFIFISELMCELMIAQINPDIVFSPNLQEGWEDSALTPVKLLDYNKRRHYVITLHDIIPLIYEKDYLQKGNPSRKWYFEKLSALRNADVITTVSEASKIEIEKYLQLPNVVVIKNGIEDTLFTDKKSCQNDIESAYKIALPFILYTGGMNPHKNLNRLFGAYADLPEVNEKYHLVVAGKIPDYIDVIKGQLKKLNILEKVIFTDYISDDELTWLYQNCDLFVFPSYREGFGIPPLEAMACGAITIVADIPVMHEVIGELPEAFFDPFSVTSIQKCMKHALENEDFREKALIYSRSHVQTMSWVESAKKLIKLFNSIQIDNHTHKLKMDDIINILIQKIIESPYHFTKRDKVQIAQLIDINSQR